MNAAAMIAHYKRYGASDPGGEWAMIDAEHRNGYIALLRRGDAPALQLLLDSKMFSLCNGLLSPLATGEINDPAYMERAIQRMLRDWLLHTSELADIAAGEFCVSILECPKVPGAPVILCSKVPFLPDTLRHDHYAVQIGRYVDEGDVVVEIGSGYGGMALQVLRRVPDVQLVLIDLPETLYIAAHFLTVATGTTPAWWDEDPTAPVVLVPAQDVERTSIKPTLVFAAHSLSEMLPDVARGYVDWMERTGTRYFYHDNAVHMPPVNEEKGLTLCQIHPEVLAKDLEPSDAYVENWRRSLQWDLDGSRYVELFYERVEP